MLPETVDHRGVIPATKDYPDLDQGNVGVVQQAHDHVSGIHEFPSTGLVADDRFQFCEEQGIGAIRSA